MFHVAEISQEAVDTVAYGSLGVDTVDQIIKQGVIMPITALTLTPPSTSGQAINYLIEAELSEVDNNTTVLSYFNSAAPTIPFTGPGGNGSSQPQTRQCTVNLVAKAGAAATAGSQTTPSPDAGYVGLWVVTVANGATQLTSAQISQYSGAPFITVKLPQVPGWVQGGTWAWATDTGSANAIAVTLNPAPTTINAGFEIWFKKAVVSSGPVTIVVNGASPVAVVNVDASALSSTVTMNAGVLIGIKFDGTSWRWINPSTSTAVGALTASSGEGITVNGSAVVALNLPGLTALATVASADLWPFYSQSAGHHRVMSWTQLLAAVQSALTLPSYSLQETVYATPGTTTFTVPAGITRIKIRLWAGGGGAGGASGVAGSGSGGGGAGYSEGTFAVTPSQTYVVVVGAGGGGGGSGANGAAGGSSSVAISGGAALLYATGGGGGYGGVGVIAPTLAAQGAGAGGALNLSGMNNGTGFQTSSGYIGGFGGAAYCSSISGPNDNSIGSPGCFPGGGGSGAAGGNYAGGNGAGGQVIIEY